LNAWIICNMRKTILKLKLFDFTPNCFIEIGLDVENNKYIVGVSTEIEKNGMEYRISEFPQQEYKILDVFVRIWILKYAISIGIGEIEIMRKDRYNLKFLFGLAAKI